MSPCTIATFMIGQVNAILTHSQAFVTFRTVRDVTTLDQSNHELRRQLHPTAAAFRRHKRGTEQQLPVT
jgi:hypothetical protein